MHHADLRHLVLTCMSHAKKQHAVKKNAEQLPQLEDSKNMDRISLNQVMAGLLRAQTL